MDINETAFEREHMTSKKLERLEISSYGFQHNTVEFFHQKIISTTYLGLLKWTYIFTTISQLKIMDKLKNNFPLRTLHSQYFRNGLEIMITLVKLKTFSKPSSDWRFVVFEERWLYHACEYL